eukprot:TRINITY_DN2895_c0_g1_i2.p1 TRINITY_DN2895_c0_g1~~TRINITY_DN2895_c0_g1_i2.p1  ORF type:complete len:310 (-),score=86.33 TRINITY_DN2895_c0_g1_i2:36-965(-)
MDIRQFTRYTIRNMKNQEVGGEVRTKAGALVELLHDKKLLKTERRKAKATRGKYTASVTNEDSRFQFSRRGGGKSEFRHNIDEWNYDSSDSSEVDEAGTTEFQFENNAPVQVDETEIFDEGEDPFAGFDFGRPPTSSNSLSTGGSGFDFGSTTAGTNPTSTGNTPGQSAPSNPFDFLTASGPSQNNNPPQTNDTPPQNNTFDIFGTGSTQTTQTNNGNIFDSNSGSISNSKPVDAKDPWAKSHLFDLGGITNATKPTGPTLGQTIAPTGSGVQFNFNSNQSTGNFTTNSFGHTNTGTQPNNNNNAFNFF